ncbi:phage virion morphogenesis protein [Achromobacter insolitus]|uniref:phage virion morphogenesis protein n=1 Tax=Achromobacter insolitus TaxID=217204 RepID=UPI0007C7AE76|nr:phage virion morphogenesis protein [Achromobacter insolitus]OAE63683.1 phage virion morphogenesis protein [Achromobacter insolitus]
MSNELERIEDWAAGLMARLSASQRRSVNVKVGQALRRSQVKRITQQKQPDGSAYPARKQKKNLRGKRGRVKRRAMFLKLKGSRHLRAIANTDAAQVGFLGKVARIARVHQRGQNDRPGPDMPDVRYPRRELLGFTADDIELVKDTLLKHLAGNSF